MQSANITSVSTNAVAESKVAQNSVGVSDWTSFINGFSDANVGYINLQNDINVTGVVTGTEKGANQDVLNLTGKGIARKVTINGNGHTINFNNYVLKFENENQDSAHTNWDIIFDNLTIKADEPKASGSHGWYSPIYFGQTAAGVGKNAEVSAKNQKNIKVTFNNVTADVTDRPLISAATNGHNDEYYQVAFTGTNIITNNGLDHGLFVAGGNAGSAVDAGYVSVNSGTTTINMTRTSSNNLQYGGNAIRTAQFGDTNQYTVNVAEGATLNINGGDNVRGIYAADGTHGTVNVDGTVKMNMGGGHSIAIFAGNLNVGKNGSIDITTAQNQTGGKNIATFDGGQYGVLSIGIGQPANLTNQDSNTITDNGSIKIIRTSTAESYSPMISMGSGSTGLLKGNFTVNVNEGATLDLQDSENQTNLGMIYVSGDKGQNKAFVNFNNPGYVNLQRKNSLPKNGSDMIYLESPNNGVTITQSPIAQWDESNMTSAPSWTWIVKSVNSMSSDSTNAGTGFTAAGVKSPQNKAGDTKFLHSNGSVIMASSQSGSNSFQYDGSQTASKDSPQGIIKQGSASDGADYYTPYLNQFLNHFNYWTPQRLAMGSKLLNNPDITIKDANKYRPETQTIYGNTSQTLSDLNPNDGIKDYLESNGKTTSTVDKATVNPTSVTWYDASNDADTWKAVMGDEAAPTNPTTGNLKTTDTSAWAKIVYQDGSIDFAKISLNISDVVVSTYPRGILDTTMAEAGKWYGAKHLSDLTNDMSNKDSRFTPVAEAKYYISNVYIGKNLVSSDNYTYQFDEATQQFLSTNDGRTPGVYNLGIDVKDKNNKFITNVQAKLIICQSPNAAHVYTTKGVMPDVAKYSKEWVTNLDTSNQDPTRPMSVETTWTKNIAPDVSKYTQNWKKPSEPHVTVTYEYQGYTLCRENMPVMVYVIGVTPKDQAIWQDVQTLPSQDSYFGYSNAKVPAGDPASSEPLIKYLSITGNDPTKEGNLYKEGVYHYTVSVQYASGTKYENQTLNGKPVGTAIYDYRALAGAPATVDATLIVRALPQAKNLITSVGHIPDLTKFKDEDLINNISTKYPDVQKGVYPISILDPREWKSNPEVGKPGDTDTGTVMVYYGTDSNGNLILHSMPVPIYVLQGMYHDTNAYTSKDSNDAAIQQYVEDYNKDLTAKINFNPSKLFTTPTGLTFTEYAGNMGSFHSGWKYASLDENGNITYLPAINSAVSGEYYLPVTINFADGSSTTILEKLNLIPLKSVSITDNHNLKITGEYEGVLPEKGQKLDKSKLTIHITADNKVKEDLTGDQLHDLVATVGDNNQISLQFGPKFAFQNGMFSPNDKGFTATVKATPSKSKLDPLSLFAASFVVNPFGRILSSENLPIEEATDSTNSGNTKDQDNSKPNNTKGTTPAVDPGTTTKPDQGETTKPANPTDGGNSKDQDNSKPNDTTGTTPVVDPGTTTKPVEDQPTKPTESTDNDSTVQKPVVQQPTQSTSAVDHQSSEIADAANEVSDTQPTVVSVKDDDTRTTKAAVQLVSDKQSVKITTASNDVHKTTLPQTGNKAEREAGIVGLVLAGVASMFSLIKVSDKKVK